jgi:hypothetical protein
MADIVEIRDSDRDKVTITVILFHSSSALRQDRVLVHMPTRVRLLLHILTVGRSRPGRVA